MDKNEFDGVKTFSATKFEDRNKLGDVVTAWLTDPGADRIHIVDKVVTQSSDQAFHCLTITLFYKLP